MIRRSLSVVFLVGICHVPLNGQHTPTNSSTTPAPQARYEILLADPIYGSTYRLDRYTGRVDRLVKTTGDYAWQEMAVPDRDEQPTNRPRFQMFTSGSDTSQRVTFLIDSDTGKTWRADWDRGTGGARTNQVWTPVP